MPKIKTHRGAVKRFRKTAKGYKVRRANRNHILTKKSTNRKRRLRIAADASALCKSDAKLVKQMLVD